MSNNNGIGMNIWDTTLFSRLTNTKNDLILIDFRLFKIFNELGELGEVYLENMGSLKLNF